MPTIIDGSGSATFNTPLPASQGGTGFSTFPWFTGVSEFTTVGTTNWTVPAGVTRARITVVGGGGGGRNAFLVGGTTSVQGPGGGNGGVAIGYVTGLTPGSTIVITVGAGGALGTNGGDSSFGTYLIGGGGKAGTYTGTAVTQTGGAIGTCSGTITYGVISFKATAGTSGLVADSGNGYLGSVAGGTNTLSAYGTGGYGGGARTADIQYGGGAGTQGCVIVEY